MSAVLQTDNDNGNAFCVPCREEGINVCQCAKRDVINELVNFHIQNTPDNCEGDRYNKIIGTIKPLGAFKESPYLYAYIKRYCDNDYRLHIVCDNIASDSNFNDDFHIQNIRLCKNKTPSSITLRDTIIDAIDTLTQIQFCKISGKFIKSDLSKGASLSNIFHRLWDLQTDLDCCVCKDETETETACGHKLCLICWMNINGISSKKNKQPRCPICRESIKYKEKWYDSDDYGDDID
jgi:hypothetical protein